MSARLEDPDRVVEIGRASADHLRIRLLRRMHPKMDDYWDGNWVAAAVEIRAGGFRGAYEASLRTDELAAFRADLRRLDVELSGIGELHSMEDWLHVTVRGDGRGHFEAECSGRDRAGVGNQLSFRLEFDQTELPSLLSQLDRVLEGFPVLGTP